MNGITGTDLQKTLRWSPARMSMTFDLNPRKLYAALPAPVDDWAATLRQHHHYFLDNEFLTDFESAMILDNAVQIGALCYAMKAGPRAVYLWRRQHARFASASNYEKASMKWKEAVGPGLDASSLEQATGIPALGWMRYDAPAKWVLDLVDNFPPLRLRLFADLLSDDRWELRDPARIRRTFALCYRYYFESILSTPTTR